MIYLHSFGKNLGVLDPSPFVMKVDAFLRMAGIEFEHVSSIKNLKHAPKGKLPYVVDADNTIADSQAIIEYFQQQQNYNLDNHLNDQQRAQSYLLTKSLDENLYNILVYSRWCRDDTWPIIEKAFFSRLPLPVKFLLPKIIRRHTMKGLYAQGIARHSDQELQAMMRKNMQSLSELLANNDYFFNDSPSSFDAAAFGLLSAFIKVNIDNPFNRIARDHQNLADFCQRIENKYYS